MSGICIHCGKQMKWTGHLWLRCEYCGKLQMWPTEHDMKDYQMMRNWGKKGEKKWQHV